MHLILYESSAYIFHARLTQCPRAHEDVFCDIAEDGGYLLWRTETHVREPEPRGPGSEYVVVVAVLKAAENLSFVIRYPGRMGAIR